MSEGGYLYANGDAETREWFERQWRIWPLRANPDLTTNIQLHYEGVVAYREIHGHEPSMSVAFYAQVSTLDRLNGVSPLAPAPVTYTFTERPLSKRQMRRLRGRRRT